MARQARLHDWETAGGDECEYMQQQRIRSRRSFVARTVARAGAAGMWARNMLSITVLGLVESYTSLRILTSWSYEMVFFSLVGGLG